MPASKSRKVEFFSCSKTDPLRVSSPWLPQGHSRTLGKGHLGCCSCFPHPAASLSETLCKAPNSHRCGPGDHTPVERWLALPDCGMDPVWGPPRNSGHLWVSVGPPSTAPFLLQRSPLWGMDVWPRHRQCWWEKKNTVGMCICFIASSAL